MLVQMTVSKDLYYEGEITTVPDELGKKWIKEGYAKPYTCPYCGTQMKENCCKFYCPDCDFKEDRH